MPAVPHRPTKMTPARRKALLDAFGVNPCYTRAAEAIGIGLTTLRRWRKADPALQDELDAIEEEVAGRIGRLYRSKIEEHARAAGTLVEWSVTEEADDQGVLRVTKREKRRAELNAALARTALHKLDPTWTTANVIPEGGGAKADASLVEALVKAVETPEPPGEGGG